MAREMQSFGRMRTGHTINGGWPRSTALIALVGLLWALIATCPCLAESAAPAQPSSHQCCPRPPGAVLTTPAARDCACVTTPTTTTLDRAVAPMTLDAPLATLLARHEGTPPLERAEPLQLPPLSPPIIRLRI